MNSFSLQEINDVLQGEIIGTTSCKITAPEQLELAGASDISIIGHKKYEKFWANSKACAAVVNEDISIEPGEKKAFIKVQNADLAMSQVLELFAPPTPLFSIDIHPTAIIDKTAIIGNGTRIGAGSYIGPKVQLGENVTIYPNVTILDECTIGKNTVIAAQTGIAGSTKIGENCMIGGQVGFAGHLIIGNNVKIGGQVGISGHLKIGNNVEIAGGSGVIKDIPDNIKVMGYPAKSIREFLKENK